MQSPVYWRLSGFYFFYFAFIGAFQPYFSLYLKSLAFSAAQIGVLMSMSHLTRIVSPNFWGWVADHTGRRVAIVQWASAMSLLSFAGLFFGASMPWILIMSLLMGLFWSGSLPIVEAITLTELRDEPHKYGRVRLWGSVGFIAATMAAGVALDYIPIRHLLTICIFLLLGVVAITWKFDETPAAIHAHDHEPVWDILKRPEVITLFVACFLMIAAHGPLYVFYSIYLVDHGYSKTAVGALIGVSVASEIIVFLYQPKLFQRFSLRAVMLACFAIAVVRFFVIGWGAEYVVLLVVAQLMHAATFGAFHAASVAAIHNIFKGKHQARGQTLYTSVAYGMGGTIGGLASGFLWERVGPYGTYQVAAATALVGLLLVWWKLRLPDEKNSAIS
jgi:MFS transporter, PPP family, 3-phenylpropionic acid transporter